MPDRTLTTAGPILVVIALTGWGQESDRERSRAVGCDSYLVKPVHLHDLETLLNELAEDERP